MRPACSTTNSRGSPGGACASSGSCSPPATTARAAPEPGIAMVRPTGAALAGPREQAVVARITPASSPAPARVPFALEPRSIASFPYAFLTPRPRSRLRPAVAAPVARARPRRRARGGAGEGLPAERRSSGAPQCIEGNRHRHRDPQGAHRQAGDPLAGIERQAEPLRDPWSGARRAIGRPVVLAAGAQAPSCSCGFRRGVVLRRANAQEVLPRRADVPERQDAALPARRGPRADHSNRRGKRRRRLRGTCAAASRGRRPRSSALWRNSIVEDADPSGAGRMESTLDTLYFCRGGTALYGRPVMTYYHGFQPQ